VRSRFTRCRFITSIVQLKLTMSQQPSASPLFTSQPEAAMPEVDAALRRFWDVVRRSAETMVSLRQDNARLTDEVRRLTDAVAELTRNLELAQQVAAPVASYEREQELLDQLAIASTEYERYRDATAIVQHNYDALKLEHAALLEEQEAVRQQPQTEVAQAEPAFVAADTHEMLMARISQLEHTVALYRAASFANIENPHPDGQISLFAPAPLPNLEKGAPVAATESAAPSLSGQELRAIASRLDSVAERIGGLFGIS
jgi:hypothetical protein